MRKFLTVLVDEATVETLRQMAVDQGITVRRGPGAQTGQGSISKLLIELARNYQRLGPR